MNPEELERLLTGSHTEERIALLLTLAGTFTDSEVEVIRSVARGDMPDVPADQRAAMRLVSALCSTVKGITSL